MNNLDGNDSKTSSANCEIETMSGKRKRKKTDRFGHDGGIYKDFDDDDADDDDVLDIDKSFSGDQTENHSETSLSKDKSQAKNTHTITPQMSRIEAKLDGLVDVIHKIQRMIIALTINPTNVDVNSANHNFVSMLPLTTEESMDRFEDNLSDAVFRRSVIEHLCTINGTNGAKDGGKVIRSVVFATICPSVLMKFTWTGNSEHNKPGHKKDFKQKRNIFGVFFDVIYAYNKKYTKRDCEDDLKNRIFKHIKTKAAKAAHPNLVQTIPSSTPLVTLSPILPPTSQATAPFVHSMPMPMPNGHDQHRLPQNHVQPPSTLPLPQPLSHQFLQSSYPSHPNVQNYQPSSKQGLAPPQTPYYYNNYS